MPKFFPLALLLLAGLSRAEVVEYSLEVSFETLNISGAAAQGMLLNGSYPGPVLRFREGDTARIHVSNRTDVDTAVHWHGLLVPPSQDGVPYISNLPIGPGETFTYEFPLRQAGTYWYHSHTDLQEQSGVHGGLVIEPRMPSNESQALSHEPQVLSHEPQALSPSGEPMRDAVVVLQDWTDEDPEQVLRNLKKDGHYYSRKKNSVVSLAGHLRRDALRAWWDNRWIRMGGMDVSDVGYDAFFANGQRELRLFPDAVPGERVRLRLINAATSTYFILHGKALPLQVVAADGLDVEPVTASEILHAVGETYDVIVAMPRHGAVELRASAQDGTGFASILLGRGTPRRAEPLPRPNPYQSHAARAMGGASDASDAQRAHQHHPAQDGKRLAYGDLRTLNPGRHFAPQGQLETSPIREVPLRLTGDMETFNWTFDGIPLSKADKIHIERGEVVRFLLVNETMMHHPLHLHGHFFRVLSGPDAGPMKHTVDVPPMSRQVIEFYAQEEEGWFFHCHNLYHAVTGMGRILRYSDYAGNPAFDRAAKNSPDIRDDDWYWTADLSLLSGHSYGEGWFANSTHRLEWEAERHEEHGGEAYAAYLHRQSRFLQWLVGIEKEEGEAAQVRAGLRYLLPLMVEADVYATDQGEVEAALETQVQLSAAIALRAEWETTREHRLSLEYRLSDRLSIELARFDDTDATLGLRLRF